MHTMGNQGYEHGSKTNIEIQMQNKETLLGKWLAMKAEINNVYACLNLYYI